MSGRPLDETRRDFLLRLARTTALVAPVVATLRPSPAASQGKGSGQAQAQAAANSAVAAASGGLSPASTTLIQSSPSGTEQLQQPWDPAAATQSPPWERPPPTAGG